MFCVLYGFLMRASGCTSASLPPSLPPYLPLPSLQPTMSLKIGPNIQIQIHHPSLPSSLPPPSLQPTIPPSLPPSLLPPQVHTLSGKGI